ncbi:MAG: GntR family transcriptional regulator [Gammaproteobacteria bacterium]|nr:GntR family transcriptional regulator [Gammaproteobacteria bacterium]MBU1415883.1 GntR family transcriptional regulator [Gammaproteobacteria bacterium]
MNAREVDNQHSRRQLSAPALYEQVAEQLRSRIYAHDLAPGAWIDEQAITAEYGISRTPLREALKVLASEGLVTLKPRRGCYVTELSEQDLDEIFPVMALLESRCALEATEKADAADLARLGEIHADLERYAADNDADHFFEANQRFHDALQELADNRWLKQLIEETRKFIKLTRRDSLNLAGRLRQSLAEHRDILAAVQQKRPNDAADLMHRHILSGRAALAKLHTSR